MNKVQLASLLVFLTTLSGVTYYTLNDHTTFLRNAQEAEIYEEWIKWQEAHGKQYKPEEAPLKFVAFSKNYDFVKNFDPEKKRSFTVGLNKFADLTNEEFVAHVQQGKLQDFSQLLQQIAIPSSVNWETKGVLPPTKDQGQCGSAAIYAAVGAIEALYDIVKGKQIQFSIQQLIDCLGQGCNGGVISAESVYEYATKYGLQAAGNYQYPYTPISNGTCKYDPSKVVFKLSGYTQVPANSNSALQDAVNKQPVTAAIEADNASFQMYTGGIYDDISCGTNVDHVVVVAGYQTGSQNYWIVQNSWGTSWGLEGNIWIAFDPTKQSDPGVCGINTDANYPDA